MGVKLAQAGHDIGVVARGATLAALREHGLRLIEGGETQTVRVRAAEDPAELGVQDLVVVAVKGPAMASVAAHIAPLLGPQTLVLTAMNGVPWWFCDGLGGDFAGKRLKSVDPDGAIAAAIPGEQTVGCVVHASCLVEAPGVIRHHQGNGLIVGEAAGRPSERVKALTEALVAAGFNASMSDQIQRDVWYKLWGNMTMNPISAMTGVTTDRILSDELVRNFVTSIMLEAKEIGARFGIPIDQAPQDRHAVTLKLGAMKTSMLQDVEARKPVELDALVSAVRELGQLTGVQTPYTDALLGLARLHASTLGLY
jgi:2-dehydropantoate 2-reductase